MEAGKQISGLSKISPSNQSLMLRKDSLFPYSPFPPNIYLDSQPVSPNTNLESKPLSPNKLLIESIATSMQKLNDAEYIEEHFD